MRSKSLMLLAVALVLGGTVFSLGFAGTAQRSDCPGKITCPLTGEKVCKDRCPLFDADRSDCPGQVECPLTGELGCRDRCPLGDKATGQTTSAKRPCCRHAAR